MQQIYHVFKNLLLTSEYLFGILGYWIDYLFPSSYYKPRYYYICQKTWFQILADKVSGDEK